MVSRASGRVCAGLRPTIRVRRAAVAVGSALLLAVLLAGCVVIPYRPESETTRDLAEVPDPERIRLSVGPRRFLEQMGDELRDEDERIELLDGQTFIDTAAPDGNLSLARLLEPSTRSLIEPLQADYLVLLGERQDETVSDWGGVAAWIGFYGLGKARGSSTYWAALVDLRTMKLVEQLTTTSTGTDAGMGLFYGVFVVSDTGGSAQKGVIRNLAKTLAAAKPQGPVQVVLLAKEALLTPQEIAMEGRARELKQRRTAGGLALVGMDPTGGALVDGYPPYSEAPAPGAGEGLVYLYRPERAMGGLLPLSIRADSGEGEVEMTRLMAGGFFPYRVEAGPVRLWVQSDPDAALDLDVQSGVTYYVLGSTRMGWKSPRGELTLVDAAEAKPAIIVCRLLPSMRDYVADVRKLAEEGYTYQQLELARLYSLGVPYAEEEALPIDRVEAYKWYTVVMESEGTAPWMLDSAQRDRGQLGTTMSADEIAEGYRRGHEWLESFEKAFLAAPGEGFGDAADAVQSPAGPG